MVHATHMEMQTKTTVPCHLMPTRMTVIKQWKITSVGEDVQKLEHLYLTDGM